MGAVMDRSIYTGQAFRALAEEGYVEEFVAGHNEGGTVTTSAGMALLKEELADPEGPYGLRLSAKGRQVAIEQGLICDGSTACRAAQHTHGCMSDDPCQHPEEQS